MSIRHVLPQICNKVPIQFTDPSTGVLHLCKNICHVEDPGHSPTECKQFCPDFNNCLLKSVSGFVEEQTTPGHIIMDTSQRTWLIISEGLLLTVALCLVVVVVLYYYCPNCQFKYYQQIQNSKHNTDKTNSKARKYTKRNKLNLVLEQNGIELVKHQKDKPLECNKNQTQKRINHTRGDGQNTRGDGQNTPSLMDGLTPANDLLSVRAEVHMPVEDHTTQQSSTNGTPDVRHTPTRSGGTPPLALDGPDTIPRGHGPPAYMPSSHNLQNDTPKPNLTDTPKNIKSPRSIKQHVNPSSHTASNGQTQTPNVHQQIPVNIGSKAQTPSSHQQIPVNIDSEASAKPSNRWQETQNNKTDIYSLKRLDLEKHNQVELDRPPQSMSYLGTKKLDRPPQSMSYLGTKNSLRAKIHSDTSLLRMPTTNINNPIHSQAIQRTTDSKHVLNGSGMASTCLNSMGSCVPPRMENRPYINTSMTDRFYDQTQNISLMSQQQNKCTYNNQRSSSTLPMADDYQVGSQPLSNSTQPQGSNRNVPSRSITNPQCPNSQQPSSVSLLYRNQETWNRPSSVDHYWLQSHQPTDTTPAPGIQAQPTDTTPAPGIQAQPHQSPSMSYVSHQSPSMSHASHQSPSRSHVSHQSPNRSHVSHQSPSRSPYPDQSHNTPSTNCQSPSRSHLSHQSPSRSPYPDQQSVNTQNHSYMNQSETGLNNHHISETSLNNQHISAMLDLTPSPCLSPDSAIEMYALSGF